LSIVDKSADLTRCFEEHAKLANKIVEVENSSLSMMAVVALNADIGSLRMLLAETAIAFEPLKEAVREMLWQVEVRRSAA
jgi:hypothetical protein